MKIYGLYESASVKVIIKEHFLYSSAVFQSIYIFFFHFSGPDSENGYRGKIDLSSSYIPSQLNNLIRPLACSSVSTMLFKPFVKSQNKAQHQLLLKR